AARDLAEGYRDDAAISESATLGYRNAAEGFRNEAEDARDITEGYRDQVAGWIDTNTTPYVILATGQSNMRISEAMNWTPPANLMVWDHANTQFVPCPTTSMHVAYSYAAEVAR